MAEYNPDSWYIIKISDLKNNSHHYRILCSWSGSYLWGSSWKISSGIESVEDCGDHFVMPQTSGSVYRIYKTQQRMSGQMSSILSFYSERSEDMTIETVEIEDFLKVFNS